MFLFSFSRPDMTSTTLCPRTEPIPEEQLPDSSTSGPSSSPIPNQEDSFLQQGQSINNFTIKHMIASGGMGRIYVAEDQTLDQEIALKILDGSEKDDDEEHERRFRTEIRALARIDHSNVISIYSAGKLGQTYYYSMPYIRGNSLFQILEDHAPLPYRLSLMILIELMEALQEIHQSQVIHQDINAANVMVDNEGELFVTDFGISDIRESIYREKPDPSSHFIGTPEYASPERILGKHIDFRTDLFSTGVLLYRMLTGTFPYEDDDSREILRKIREEDHQSIKHQRKSCPRSLSDLCDTMLEKDKSQRPCSARTVQRKAKRLLQRYDSEKTSFETERFPALSEKYTSDPSQSYQHRLHDLYSSFVDDDTSS